jgi:Na+/pantothenate symporter
MPAGTNGNKLGRLVSKIAAHQSMYHHFIVNVHIYSFEMKIFYHFSIVPAVVVIFHF